MEALTEEQFQSAEDMYKDIQEQYRRALNDIQMDITTWYQRLADNNEISYAGAKKLLKKDELEEFHWTVEKYIEIGEQNAIDQRWMKELENASAKYHISRLEAMKLQMQQHAELLSAELEGGVTDYLHESYGEQYYRTAFEIAKGTGIGSNLVKLDDKRIDTILKQPWARDGQNFSDRIWFNKEKLVNNLHAELTQCIIRGESPVKAISRLVKTMDVSKSQAGNLIMTETAAISSKAQKDCFNELGVEEFEVVETLDSHTCEICQAMDGKHYPMSYYRIGETAPPFHPRCRGCTCPYFDDEFSGGERAARDPETGKTVYVPADMTYQEWKKTFVSNSVSSGRQESKVIRLSKEEKGAIIRYVSPDSYILNDKLRRGESLTETEKKWKEKLDNALEKLPCYVGNLNRSLTFSFDEDAKIFYDSLTPGQKYVPLQYFSTTKSGIYNEDGQVQIYIRNAKKGRDLGKLAIEDEVLYQIGSEFIILDKVGHEGKYYILLEEL